jgi:ABC-type uncharacterized transport system involved in gliding motility auxiliary subunit
MQLNKRTRLQLQLQKYLFIVLLLTAAGMLAWLSTQYSSQFDWTAGARNSLSQSSADLLTTLKDPVVVNVYVHEDPTTRQAVEEILKRYQREKTDFRFHLINPDIDIEQAQQDQISASGQIIIKYQGRKETLTSLSEQSISGALLRLSRDSARKVVFLSGHDERDPLAKDNRSYNTLSAQLTSKGFAVESINLLQKTIASDTRVLVIASPSRPLLKGELEHIRKFIADGGNLLWLADPGELAGMEPIAKDLGLVFQPGMVVDNNVNLRATLQIEHPAVIPVLEYYSHPITTGIKYNTLFPLARGIDFVAQDDKDTKPEWQHNELFRSFEKSWTETGDISKPIVFNSADGDVAGPITLSVALERKLAPAEDKPASKASQRIVVIGDSDFLSNAYLGTGANLSLGMNIFNWLAGDDDLIAVEPKSAPDTRLQLNDSQVMLIGVGFFLAIPAVLLASGFTLWFKRRKR